MNLVGMMWARNEGDIIRETVTDAAKQVDHLLVAEGGSTDDTWHELKDLRLKNVELLRGDERNDPAQRNAMLDLIRARWNPVDTLVQIIEGDVFLLETNVREAWRDHAVADVAMGWLMLNAVRLPGTWRGIDTYPHWEAPIREIMTHAHELERVTYTFRPLPGLRFDPYPWRPWPRGFSQYTTQPLDQPRGAMAPLLLHCGYRGPTHFHQKYRHMGKRHTKYRNWRVDSPENVERTVSFFNGQWNGNAFPATREGWRNKKREAHLGS